MDWKQFIKTIIEKMAYMTGGAGWLNFFFLGAGGSGMPYFSLLSAARSLYFSYLPAGSKKKYKIQSHRVGEQYDSLAAEWFCFETNLGFISLQLFELCFGHFRSLENLKVFLETIRWIHQLVNGLMALWIDTLDFHFKAWRRCVVLPCGGQRAADVESDSPCWGTVSYTANRPASSSPSSCPGLLLHRPAPIRTPRGRCLHCKLPPGHTNRWTEAGVSVVYVTHLH